MAQIEPPVFFLVAMFGSSTWMTINAIWVELSLYTNRLPEAWSLPSYLATVIQIACLLTLAYSIAHRYTRFNAHKAPLILALLIFTSICMLLLAFYWERTLWIGGKQYSFALIGLTFLMASVCAASNVFFLPYMSTFHPTYMTAFFVGMSFSSLVPSLLKIIQGVGKYNCVEIPTQNGTTTIKPVPTDPMFSVRIYNLIIFAWMCAATLSFALLHWKYGQKKEEVKNENGNGQSTTNNNDENGHGQSSKSEGNNQQQPQNRGNVVNSGEEDEQTPLKPKVDREPILAESSSNANSTSSSARYWTLIFVLALICAEMNTIVPSIQSYATLAYSMLTYHLALTLSNISHPLANFLPIFFKPNSLAIILMLTSISTAGTAFIFMLALQSPNPFLHNTFPMVGSILSISASILVGFFTSYLRTHLTGLIRSEQKNSESALFWCGFFMQIGSFIGACAMFPLVNVAQIFQKRDPCTP